MTHFYAIPIRVWHKDHQPYALIWRGVRYRVLNVNEPWHLQDRWWVSASGADANGGKGHSDRWYYRLCCHEAGAAWEMVCDVYYDTVANVWVMERILD